MNTKNGYSPQRKMHFLVPNFNFCGCGDETLLSQTKLTTLKMWLESPKLVKMKFTTVKSKFRPLIHQFGTLVELQFFEPGNELCCTYSPQKIKNSPHWTWISGPSSLTHEMKFWYRKQNSPHYLEKNILSRN